MRMKKIFIVIVALISVFVMAIATACAKEKPKLTLETVDWDNLDFKSGTKVEGVSAMQVFIDAIAYYEAAERKTKINITDGAAKVIGIEADQTLCEIVKRDGNEYFFQQTAYGTGLGKTNVGNRYYFDGTKAYHYDNKNFTKTIEDVKTPDFSSAVYGDYDASNQSVEDKNAGYDNFTSYEISIETKAANSDENLYELDGKYYAEITVDCMQNGQEATRKVIENALGAKDLKWLSDSRYLIQFTMIDGTYAITAFKLYEHYEGNKTLNVEVNQTVTANIGYGDLAIINADEKPAA